MPKLFSVLAALLLGGPAAALAQAPAATGADPAQWVDPRIGTGGHGHCFPGSSVPFAAVQLSPDTFNDQWDWCSGYHVSDSSIMGFSQTCVQESARAISAAGMESFT